jgi:DnaD/phage-associated family protein
MGVLMNKLQIRGRRLTPAEEKYAAAWLDMGMEDALFDMAYERTCLNTGGMNWQYMNKILTSWHQAGLHTVEEVRTGDRKKGTKSGHRDLDAEELAAIQRMMKEQ